jgi:hypothetical protein
MSIRTKASRQVFWVLLGGIVFSAEAPLTFAASECSREWATENASGKNSKIVGLGLSSQADPRLAHDEARAAAFKDISLQLQTSVESRSEVKESQSESTFSANSVLTSNTEDLIGMKAVKNGKNIEEKVKCEVYEFNVMAAHEDQSSKLSVVQDKIDKLNELGEQKKWVDIVHEFGTFKPLLTANSVIIKRADLFKTYLNIPGPGWSERFQKSTTQLEDLNKKARAHIVFVFQKGQFEDAVSEAEGKITNAGAKVEEDVKSIPADSTGILVTFKTLGTPRKAKSLLGLTMTRKVAIALTATKTQKKLSASNGLNIVGTSADGDVEEALANSDQQIIAALMDSIRNAVPDLIK